MPTPPRGVQQLEARLKAAEAARVPARELQTAAASSLNARSTLQKARAAFGAGDYAATVTGDAATGDHRSNARLPRQRARRPSQHAHSGSTTRAEVARPIVRAASAPSQITPPSRSGRVRRRATRRAACRPATRPRRPRDGAAVRRSPRPPPRTHRCPTPRVGPTPRSQIRIRTRSGASTVASSTFVPSGKCGWTARRAASVCRRASRDLAEHDALRIADAQRDDVDVLAVDVERPLSDCSGLPIAARNV